jgi:hypothetical protein
MTMCHVQASASVELFFYGELSGSQRDAVERHLVVCLECRRSLDELAMIRSALGARPDVSSPPSADWSGFMSRLDRAVRADAAASIGGGPGRTVQRGRRTIATALAAAALAALVTMGVWAALRERAPSEQPAAAVPATELLVPAAVQPADADAVLAQDSEGLFERSKLVVLGLATRDAADASADDWSYERTLAASLLSDTRLYRQAAEERGMTALAGVMRDLELVLLQTAMSEKPDAGSLGQLQRLIRRRDLITKMDVVATTGLLP